MIINRFQLYKYRLLNRFDRKKVRRSDCIESDLGSEPQTKQIMIDVSIIYRHDARTGIQRVVRSIFLQLLRSPIAGYELRPIFATRRHEYYYANRNFLQASNTEKDTDRSENGTLVSAGPGDIFLGLDLAANLLPRYKSQIRRWQSNGASIYIVVYDLLPAMQRKWFHRKTRRNFARWLRFILGHADGVLCISSQVSNNFRELLEGVRISKNLIRVSKIRLGGNLHDSAPSRGLPHDANCLFDLLKSGTTTLMVGTIEPRKGYDRAVFAFETLWKSEENLDRLVIVGKPGWKTTSLQKLLRSHPEIGKRLFWLDDATDEMVEKLYELCDGVLVTSYAEGYGLPVIEALTKGKPVLARNIEVFREFENPQIDYFDRDEPEHLARSIRRWLNLPRHSVDLTEGGPISSWSDARADILYAIGASEELPQPNSKSFSQ